MADLRVRRVPFVQNNTKTLRALRKQNLALAMLNSGGPAPGGNRVAAAAAKLAHSWGIPVIGFFNGYEYLQMEPASLCEGSHFMRISPIDVSRMIDESALLIRTARANPGKNIKCPADLRDTVKTRELRNVLEVFKLLRVGALLSIGGDDTLKVANHLQLITRLAREEGTSGCFLGVVHAPKTIDNDFPVSEGFTFGFLTAAERIGEVVRGLYDDAKATNSYHVVEVMGRRAGWLTLAASMHGRGTRAIIPEEFESEGAVDLEKLAAELVELVIAREREGKAYGVFCVAEGLVELLPQDSLKDVPRDRHGNLMLAKVKLGERLADILTAKYQSRMGRTKKFLGQTAGYLARQAPPNIYDEFLTSSLGFGAARLVAHGRFGEMVTVKGMFDLYGARFEELVDPNTLRVINRLVDPAGDFYRLVRSTEHRY